MITISIANSFFAHFRLNHREASINFSEEEEEADHWRRGVSYYFLVVLRFGLLAFCQHLIHNSYTCLLPDAALVLVLT